MALELILTADTLASLKVQVAAWHNQLNGAAVPEEGQKAPSPKEPKADKPKAEKPAAKPSTDQAAAEYKKALDEAPGKDGPVPLDYQKDVVSKILAKVAELQTGDKPLDPVAAKAKVQDVIRSTFGVTNAKEVPADKWPALLEAVANV